MMRKVKDFLTLYSPAVPYIHIYMLQQVEYDAGQFAAWTNRLPNYRRVMRRKKLVRSKKAIILLVLIYAIWTAEIAAIIWLAVNGYYVLAALAFAWIPLVSILLLTAIVKLGNAFITLKRSKDLQRASDKMHHSKAIKIAVLGSYGKTTMKELLASVLSEAKKTAVTPGNRNVAISHARWINNELSGDEDIIIFEYGEYRPGDIADLAWLTHPDYAVITGFAPNHIDTYKTVEALKSDLASIKKFVSEGNLYASFQAADALDLGLDSAHIFDEAGALDWKTTISSSDFDGLKLTLKKAKRTIKLRSGLLGRHLAAPLGFAAVFAAQLGLDDKQIIKGIGKTAPFEHRLKPSSLNGAWIIDDTYNGNLEGIKAGLTLLTELPAKRKIYVTPGLVEQGSEKQRVHEEIARHIIKAKPDEVVLMGNTSTAIIAAALEEHNYNGKISTVDDPLEYYENLQYQLAAGDLVLMQNDWTDNYA